MKKDTQNTFSDALNLDLHPIVTPNTVLTDNLNGTFITYNGNEFCLQNDKGNIYKCSLTPDFIPIGAKEHNGVIYIASCKEELINGKYHYTGELGFYPGINDWSIKSGTLSRNLYSPLHNLAKIVSKDTYQVTVTNWNGDRRNDIINLLSLFGVSENTVSSTLTKQGDTGTFIIYEIDFPVSQCEYQLNAYGVFDRIELSTLTERNVEERCDFRTDKLNFDLEHPVTIDIQDSYDGSVNLILTDNYNPVRIINTGFSVNGDKYRIIDDRNQDIETNLYEEENLKEVSNLVRITSKITNVSLDSVKPGGQLKGGNYKFYVKFGDADYNQSDVVAESGIVSIFNGTDGRPDTISGTLADERTDKMVHLSIEGLNPAYSKVYIYYTREYSDTNGYRMSEAEMISEPFDLMKNGIIEDPLKIWITGFEQTTSISIEDLNIDYHTVDTAKTIAQQQDMLFLGNVGQEETHELYMALREFTKGVTTTIRQNTTLDPVSCDYKSGDEYYSTQNIHDKLGYWPDEIYRFGVVYILKDGSTTPVFNMYGGSFNAIDDVISKDSTEDNHNEYGVFKTPNVGIISNEAISPISFEFSLPDITTLNNIEFENRIIGWFVVRQKRIPRTICQGLSIGIDKESHLPMVWDGKNWIIESFLSANRLDLDGVDREVLEQEWNKAMMLYQHELQQYQDKQRFWGHFLFIDPLIWLFGSIITATNNNLTFDVENIKNYLKTKENNPILVYNSLIRTSSSYYAQYVPPTIANTTRDCDDYDDYLRWLTRSTPGGGAIEENGFLISDIDYSGNSFTVERFVYSLKKYNSNDNLNFYIYYDTNKGNPKPTELQIKYNDNNYTIRAVYSNQDLINILDEEKNRFIRENEMYLNGRGLLTLDPCVNNTISGILDGSNFSLRKEYTTSTYFGKDPETLSVNLPDNYNGETLRIDQMDYTFNNEESDIFAKCVYVGPETRAKVMNDFIFSNVAGNAYSTTDYAESTKKYYLTKEDVDPQAPGSTVDATSYLVWDNDGEHNSFQNINLIRGLFTPYVGISSNDVEKECVYSIRYKETHDLSLLFKVREQDNSPYYSVSKRNYIDENEVVFGGDCYTSTVTMRILRNFIDSTAPYAERIVNPEGWKDMMITLLGSKDTEKTNSEFLLEAQNNVNLADVNTVDLGYWVTYKCLSSFNLGLRSENTFNVQEMSIMGSPRSFYPISGLSTATGNKVEESYPLNDGLSATVGQKRYNLLSNIPYTKNEFNTRVMFSNKHVTDAFTNGYRTIQGLSYHDYDKQYGSITKLIPWGNNLFCVFEHGLAILPVNEKALMQTTTEQTIHIYGHGVLPDQMSIVSQDYGSKYADSVVRTPLGIYGIDVDAKKIWRFTDKQGFETISDMKIESFLNHNLRESYDISVNKSDVRTHYNSFKGDVIFTWYYTNLNEKREEYSICYNERQSVWTTRYDWVPIVSENKNGEFYSLQKGDDSEGNVGIYHHEPVNARPTKWYGKQHVFEFEFVVSDPIGVHKIYDDLQIISNNVQPEELSFEIIGDAYMFNKARIYHTVYDGNFGHKRIYKNETAKKTFDTDVTTEKDNTNIYNKGSIEYTEEYNNYKPFRNASILNDRNNVPNFGTVIQTENATEQYHLRIPQECRNMETWGRRLGNIHYKGDSWYTNIEPIIYDARLNDPYITELTSPATKWNSARIRDKWCKIRVRYSGEDLSIITAIKTALNI